MAAMFYALKAKKLYDNELISESNYIDYLHDIGIDSEGLDFFHINDSSAEALDHLRTFPN
jgi:hypothetical protein